MSNLHIPSASARKTYKVLEKYIDDKYKLLLERTIMTKRWDLKTTIIAKTAIDRWRKQAPLVQIAGMEKTIMRTINDHRHPPGDF